MNQAEAFQASSSLVPAELPQQASPVPSSHLDLAELLAQKCTDRRKALLEQALRSPYDRIRVPNQVSFRVDTEALMDVTFVGDLLHEAHGRPGVYIATSVAGVFEHCPEELLSSEPHPMAVELLKLVRSIDSEKQALVLFNEPVLITEDQNGKRKRESFRLVRLNLSRSSVQRMGIAFGVAGNVGGETQ